MNHWCFMGHKYTIQKVIDDLLSVQQCNNCQKEVLVNGNDIHELDETLKDIILTLTPTE